MILFAIIHSETEVYPLNQANFFDWLSPLFMKPIIHFLANLTLDGKMRTGFSDLTKILKSSSPSVAKLILTDLPCWQGKSTPSIRHESTQKILTLSNDHPQPLWLLGTSRLFSHLASVDRINFLHIWWTPTLPNVAGSPTLSSPIPMQKGFRHQFFLTQFHLDAKGFYGVYKRICL